MFGPVRPPVVVTVLGGNISGSADGLMVPSALLGFILGTSFAFCSSSGHGKFQVLANVCMIR
jgi:hypothetical protein